MKVLVLCTSLILSGCCTPKIAYKDRIVHVDRPVVQELPEPPNIPKSKLPIEKLDDNSSNDDVAKSYVLSVQLLKIENEKLREALKPYKKNVD